MMIRPNTNTKRTHKLHGCAVYGDEMSRQVTLPEAGQAAKQPGETSSIRPATTFKGYVLVSGAPEGPK